jgi:hypothetical protein
MVTSPPKIAIGDPDKTHHFLWGDHGILGPSTGWDLWIGKSLGFDVFYWVGWMPLGNWLKISSFPTDLNHLNC